MNDAAGTGDRVAMAAATAVAHILVALAFRRVSKLAYRRR
jgi:hypothetical protein